MTVARNQSASPASPFHDADAFPARAVLEASYGAPEVITGDRIRNATELSALVAENRVLANPASPGSITTSGNKEDFVSMGVTAAIKLQQIVKNTRAVLAIEALTAARALDLLAPLKSGAPVELARAGLRSVCPAWEGDQTLSDRIAAVDRWIESGALNSI